MKNSELKQWLVDLGGPESDVAEAALSRINELEAALGRMVHWSLIYSSRVDGIYPNAESMIERSLLDRSILSAESVLNAD